MTNPEESGWIGHWSPGIGDPTLTGWVTVALYAATATLCYFAARTNHARLPGSKWLREPALWQIMAIALGFLCINKQLDLQTGMTELGRILARRQGWYTERHYYQEIFIALLALCGFFAVCALILLAWRMSRPVKSALVGFCVLGVFVVTRASSFHNVDIFLGSRVLGMRWNCILEISGISIVLLAAVRRLGPLRGR